MAKEKELEQVEGQQLSVENKVESLIRVIRGQQVMLDRDLAVLYGVETRRLNEQVKRNIERFPEDFMFQLTEEECSKSQTSILVHQEMQDSRIDEFFCRLNEGKFFPFCIIAPERAQMCPL